MEEIGYYLYMSEQEKKIKAIVNEELYITEKEKELIERYRVADDVTKEVIVSLYSLKDK